MSELSDYVALKYKTFLLYYAAVIANEFREQPKNLEVAMGTDAVFDCKAPKGEPEPRVRWKKDGEAVKPSERFTIAESGSLKIGDSRREDSGVYTCVAFNMAGDKESSPARLSVRGICMFRICSQKLIKNDY